MNHIEAAATDLTAAASALEEASSQAERTVSALNVLQARLAAKQNDLTAIQARRLSGEESESDAALAQLISMDISGLEPLTGSAHAAHMAAQEAVQSAQNAVSQSQQAYERAQAQEQAVQLESRLRELEELLMNGIQQLHTLKKAASGSIHVHGQSLFAVSARLQRFLQTGVLPA
jgi:hypothetical protein